MIRMVSDVDVAQSSNMYNSFDWWKTRRSQSRLWTKYDSDPNNRYTTAPLVINHALHDWPRREGFSASELRTQARRDERNQKLKIYRKFGKLIRGSSLNLKGLVAPGEQDQEQEPWLNSYREAFTIHWISGCVSLWLATLGLSLWGCWFEPCVVHFIFIFVCFPILYVVLYFSIFYGGSFYFYFFMFSYSLCSPLFSIFCTMEPSLYTLIFYFSY
jgi:hypothetical protein